MNPEAAAAFSLLSAQAVRERAHRMLAIGLNGDLPHFRIDLTCMNGAADLVLDTMRKAYPTLDVPLHSRWRHFVTSGRDCWTAIAAQAGWSDPAIRARAEFDLVMVSVFLDAGAGPEWRYRDLTTGTSVGRSEGIALASLAMFAAGTFSSSPDDPLRVDADALKRLSSEQLQTGMQVSDFNPLIGIEGRADLLRRLGEVVAAKPKFLPATICRAQAVCSITLRLWPRMKKLPPQLCSRNCFISLARSGHRASRSEAFRLAIVGDIPRSPAQTPPTNSCRCTNSRNGWPILSSSR